MKEEKFKEPIILTSVELAEDVREKLIKYPDLSAENNIKYIINEIADEGDLLYLEIEVKEGMKIRYVEIIDEDWFKHHFSKTKGEREIESLINRFGDTGFQREDKHEFSYKFTYNEFSDFKEELLLKVKKFLGEENENK